jgi:hypothetical protein
LPSADSLSHCQRTIRATAQALGASWKVLVHVFPN